MQQYLIVGLNDFGAQVLERCRALPIDRNVVYHHLSCPPEKRVAAAYVDYRKRLLDVLNREIFNFANTPLTVYLTGLLVEEHMAENLMHLGYLFKSFFRENIILNPRVKLVTALPTILPEEAFAWLPKTRRDLDAIDGYAALKSPFTPAYPEVKRVLPSLSGPPFEEIVFCYSESLDAEDLEVSTQAAATRIYFDLVLRPARATARAEVAQFERSLPAGQGFAPVTGCALAFLPSLAKLVRDEMEYLLLMRLVERFFAEKASESAEVDPAVEGVLRKLGALRLRDLAEDVARAAVEDERWLDLAALDPAARYEIEMSPSPEAYLTGVLSGLEREQTKVASRVRDLATRRLLSLPEQILTAIREERPDLDLRAIDAVSTAAFARVAQLAGSAASLARELRGELEAAKRAAADRGARLKEIAGAKDARFKRGSETEARLKDVLRSVDTGAILRLGVAFTAAEAWAQEQQPSVEARLRAGYDAIHDGLAGFLKRRGEILAHLTQRRDAYMRRRELHLYVFNQVFRQRILDAELERVLAEAPQALPTQALAPLVGGFFFKSWRTRPDLPLDEVETELMAAVHAQAPREIEALASRIRVDYPTVVRILGEIALGQASSIFDAKYKEHPQASYRRSMFLLHRDEQAALALGEIGREGFDLVDVAHVPGLPFEVLQVMEIHNLPFRALRQYASLDRQPE